MSPANPFVDDVHGLRAFAARRNDPIVTDYVERAIAGDPSAVRRVVEAMLAVDLRCARIRARAVRKAAA